MKTAAPKTPWNIPEHTWNIPEHTWNIPKHTWNILEHTWNIPEHPRTTRNTNGPLRNTLETPGTTKILKWSIVSDQTAD